MGLGVCGGVDGGGGGDKTFGVGGGARGGALEAARDLLAQREAEQRPPVDGAKEINHWVACVAPDSKSNGGGDL